MSMLLVRAVAVAAVLVAVTTAYMHWRGVQRDFGAAQQLEADTRAMDAQKAEAAATLAQIMAARDAAEQALHAAKNKQEVSDAEHKKTVGQLTGRLRALAAGNAGRLRDPNAQACGGGSSSDGAAGEAAAAAVHSANNRAETAGLLSAQLSGLLQQLTEEADTVNLAYISCRADGISVRSTYH